MTGKEYCLSIDLIIAIIIAGLSFTLCFGLSSPSLFLNDEWITVNQVHQLVNQGSLLENEGKYGSFYTGEVSNYFLSRNNYLAYSLFLPIVSMPAMNLILFSGDNFRFSFLLFWGFIGVITLLCTLYLFSRIKNQRYYYITWLCLFLFIGFFFLNIYFYQPYPIGADRPIETAAVVFSNELLFSFIPLMLFGFFRNLSINRVPSIIASIVIMSCSTYMFWSTTAKDHLLVAFLLMALVYVGSLLVRQQSGFRWAGFFLISGLICWARPEYGVVLLAGLCGFPLLLFFLKYQMNLNPFNLSFTLRYIFWSFIGLIVGLVPFFFNNLLITGNLIIPPQYLYISSPENGRIIEYAQEVQNPGEVHLLYINQIFSFFIPRVENIFTDLYGLLVSPMNGAVGILFVCPIIIPAILYWVVVGRKQASNYPDEVKKISIFIIFLIFLTFLAYLRTLHGSIMSSGIFPDMRYFSPLYLLIGIISFLILFPLIQSFSVQMLKKLLAGFVCIPVYLIVLTLASPFGADFFMYISPLKMILFLVVILFTILGVLYGNFWRSDGIFPVLFTFMVMMPAAFQFILVFFFSFAKVNGYYFWLPFFEYLFTQVIRLIY